MAPRQLLWYCSLALFAASLAFFLYALQVTRPSEPESGSRFDGPARLSPESLEQVAHAVGEALAGRSSPVTLSESELNLQTGAVYVAVRSAGQVRAYQWGSGGTWPQNLNQALGQLPREPDLDFVEILLTHSYRPADLFRVAELEAMRGVWGLELRYQDRFVRYNPLQMVSRNFGFLTSVAHFEDELALTSEQLYTRAQALRFDGYQVLVRLEGKPRAIQLFRGQPPPLEQMSPEQLLTMRAALLDWVRGPGARLELGYQPSSDQPMEPTGPWSGQAATAWCLAQLPDVQPGEVLARLKSVDAKSSPATLALALLAAEPLPDSWRKDKLRKALERVTPEQVRPGELGPLLLWWGRHQPARLAQAQVKARQAGVRLAPWRILSLVEQGAHEPLYRECDDLLAHQGGELDRLGQFYPDVPPDSEVPPSSLNALCVIALEQAARVAQEQGHDSRARGYRKAARQARLFLYRLQFRSEDDFYYVLRPEEVEGALRSNLYDNRVRLDSASFGLVALLQREP
ncbi:hypothetical protein DYH09_29615 [bacterium CPR1]|nr:hypothetical protein [bacterium CPR1]